NTTIGDLIKSIEAVNHAEGFQIIYSGRILTNKDTDKISGLNISSLTTVRITLPRSFLTQGIQEEDSLTADSQPFFIDLANQILKGQDSNGVTNVSFRNKTLVSSQGNPQTQYGEASVYFIYQQKYQIQYTISTENPNNIILSCVNLQTGKEIKLQINDANLLAVMKEKVTACVENLKKAKDFSSGQSPEGYHLSRSFFWNSCSFGDESLSMRYSDARKVHISIARTEANMAKAYSVIMPILQKYQIRLFKIATLQSLNAAPAGSNPIGKEITIYMQQYSGLPEASPDFWLKTVLPEIVQKLKENGVQPGNPSLGDKLFPGGGGYVYARAPQNITGGYIAAEDLRALGFTRAEAANLAADNFFRNGVINSGIPDTLEKPQQLPEQCTLPTQLSPVPEGASQKIVDSFWQKCNEQTRFSTNLFRIFFSFEFGQSSYLQDPAFSIASLFFGDQNWQLEQKTGHFANKEIQSGYFTNHMTPIFQKAAEAAARIYASLQTANPQKIQGEFTPGNILPAMYHAFYCSFIIFCQSQPKEQGETHYTQEKLDAFLQTNQEVLIQAFTKCALRTRESQIEADTPKYIGELTEMQIDQLVALALKPVRVLASPERSIVPSTSPVISETARATETTLFIRRIGGILSVKIDLNQVKTIGDLKKKFKEQYPSYQNSDFKFICGSIPITDETDLIQSGITQSTMINLTLIHQEKTELQRGSLSPKSAPIDVTALITDLTKGETMQLLALRPLSKEQLSAIQDHFRIHGRTETEYNAPYAPGQKGEQLASPDKKTRLFFDLVSATLFQRLSFEQEGNFNKEESISVLSEQMRRYFKTIDFWNKKEFLQPEISQYGQQLITLLKQSKSLDPYQFKNQLEGLLKNAGQEMSPYQMQDLVKVLQPEDLQVIQEYYFNHTIYDNKLFYEFVFARRFQLVSEAEDKRLAQEKTDADSIPTSPLLFSLKYQYIKTLMPDQPYLFRHELEASAQMQDGDLIAEFQKTQSIWIQHANCPAHISDPQGLAHNGKYKIHVSLKWEQENLEKALTIFNKLASEYKNQLNIYWKYLNLRSLTSGSQNGKEITVGFDNDTSPETAQKIQAFLNKLNQEFEKAQILPNPAGVNTTTWERWDQTVLNTESKPHQFFSYRSAGDSVYFRSKLGPYIGNIYVLKDGSVKKYEHGVEIKEDIQGLIMRRCDDIDKFTPEIIAEMNKCNRPGSIKVFNHPELEFTIQLAREYFEELLRTPTGPKPHNPFPNLRPDPFADFKIQGTASTVPALPSPSPAVATSSSSPSSVPAPTQKSVTVSTTATSVNPTTTATTPSTKPAVATASTSSVTQTSPPSPPLRRGDLGGMLNRR
ncbi:MAG: hypothetical protein WC860_06125, partial [Candidatus Margulisiibacteriota bacterium]